jgi:methionyl-tRNA formyltransferase
LRESRIKIKLSKKFYVASSRKLSSEFWSNLSKSGIREEDCISSPGRLEQLSQELDPGSRVFFPHWSWIIPEEVHTRLECIMFHMTDLPMGRGGSPLQNMILLGMDRTVISAFRCEEGLDTGEVYSKVPLSLEGPAHEILSRADAAISHQILNIFNSEIKPTPQIGTPTYFSRRKPSQSRLSESLTLRQAYDLIRALDAPGYRPANFELGDLTFFFSDADIIEGEIRATVSIRQEKR